MVTSCDPINPYTQTDTFGVTYNGGYKPDKSLEWLPIDSNTLEADDFIPPPTLPPPNMLMNTREGRKIDPRIGTVTKREMDFDDFTESQEIAPITIEIGDPMSLKGGKPDEDMQWKLLALLALVVFVILSMTKFS